MLSSKKQSNLKQYLTEKLRFNNNLRESNNSQLQEYINLQSFGNNRAQSIQHPLFKIKKEAINDRTSVNLYVREGMSIPQKIRNAIRPLYTSVNKNSDQSIINSSTADHAGIKSKSTLELSKYKNNSRSREAQTKIATIRPRYKHRDKSTKEVKNPKLDENGEEIIFRGRYKIDTNHWLKVLGLKDDKIDPAQKRKIEFLKFLGSLNEHEARTYWEERAKEIDNQYKMENLEKLTENWKIVTSTWRNTHIPDKLLFFAMIDQEQEKALKLKH